MDKFIAIKEIMEAMPYVKDKLVLTKVNYSTKLNKAYFMFTSTVLINEPEFLKIEKILQSIYPNLSVAVRVASPDLKDDFLKDISAYKNVLENFLMRNTNAARAWIKDTAWELNNDRILLTCPDEYAENFYREHKFDEKISKAVWDIFNVKLPVAFVVTSQRDMWINKMRSMREIAVFEKPEESQLYNHGIEEIKASLPEQKSINEKPVEKPSKVIKRKSYIPQQQVLYGNKVDGVYTPISSCTEDAGTVTICGTIGNVETREVSGGQALILKFTVWDDTGTVYAKAYLKYGYGARKRANGTIDYEAAKRSSKVAINEMVSNIKPGDRVLLNGLCQLDTFINEPCINIKNLAKMPADLKEDNADIKRVELHLHTQMSALDATNSVSELINRAAQYGHKAIAITDHGVVQSFPEAFALAKKKNIKFIPGCELYVCDYETPVINANNNSMESSIVALDFETTGLNTLKDKIIEIGAVKLHGGTVVDTFSLLVNPKQALSKKITEITGITDMMLVNKPSPSEAVEQLLNFIGDSAVAAHNASFDMGILNSELKRMGREFNPVVIDTLVLARALYPNLFRYNLKAISKHLNVTLKNAHRAVNDATATAQCLSAMLRNLSDMGISTFDEINQNLSEKAFGNSRHMCVLVNEQEGLENLYYLISQGHLNYFRRNMRVPRFELQTHRRGLLIGSACSDGELFQAVLYGKDNSEIEKIASFYDYIEIMPIENDSYLLREGMVENYDDLKNINRKLLEIGDKLAIPVVATGDVHFLNPSDSIYRAMIQATMNYSDFDKQPPLYYRSTDEMLDAFSYLGEKDAYRVVVENTNLIADKVANIRQYPKHPDGEKATTFQPYWSDAADNIKNSTMEKAYALYGKPLPKIVQARIDKELNSILGYGFGTLYNIAQKLVLKSNEDGYVVGSRGSVGSSFVATMCGITEVNPLPAHYRCEQCHKAEFNLDNIYKTGIDLPDKKCSGCGRPMIKDGFDIPFEVFLGFEGDKVPDIDLNFSGDYQAKAHAYVEDLFGKGFVFRAGTISAMKDKTAFGYVNKYLEAKGMFANKAHKERLAQGLAGVKRTTGQHPGGMVVVPKDYSIYQFTPIQHPADDIKGDTITTHFDFNSMHDILVKLDILGHDDPTMLHELERLTGVSYKDIPLDDKKVMSLFVNPEALEVTKEQILSSTGTLGIPEFGTEFVQGMLLQTKPSTMEELIRISGLSHGTDVWLNNTETIIKEGIAKLSECVCTRDDIMNALISYGIDSKTAFDTMESVRKGRGVTEKAQIIMTECGVPQWYIDSCNKIKYMFPRAHASAYVIMALRIAYYKVYYPLAYYAAYFSIRSNGFNSAEMLVDDFVIRSRIQEKKAEEIKMTEKDKDELNVLKMILEMQCRGFKFLRADIYKSSANKFLIEGDKSLRVPLNTLPGFGDLAAEALVKARVTPFSTLDDLKERAGIGNKTLEILQQFADIGNIAKSAQTDMFSHFIDLPF